ncbi:HSPB1-associated protein 1 [Hondaea fermentalgiana]|uniref:HSPB1-associated protein 1 n=1 Tax=Hondaea fermentalgiana TaxID=2315210 RepID=A0A2R5GMP2_9STRA|nr:HSPB1-associated protein 1 [Hondaea fermentalgiana]|eukprot:GBG29134.1 HSPB1-associated protein 1 [Hondaea fermentalgiana]
MRRSKISSPTQDLDLDNIDAAQERPDVGSSPTRGIAIDIASELTPDPEPAANVVSSDTATDEIIEEQTFSDDDEEPDPSSIALESLPLEAFRPGTAETARKDLLTEFGLSGKEDYTSVAQLENAIGTRCPAFRHCGHKVSMGLANWGGGQWIDGFFHPHACWLYHHSGAEPWIKQTPQTLGRIGLLIDLLPAAMQPVAQRTAETAPAQFMESAASKWDSLGYIRASQPSNYGDERALQQQIRQTVLSMLRNSTRLDNVELLAVVRWPKVGTQNLGVARRMLRIANLLPFHSVNVVWALQAYTSGNGLSTTIRENNLAIDTIRRVRENGETGTISRRPALAFDTLQNLRPARVVALPVLMSDAGGHGDFLLVDASKHDETTTTTTTANYRGDIDADTNQRLRELSQTLPLETALQGKSLNVDPNVNILVYQTGALETTSDANSLGRVLQRHGFRNVLVLGEAASTDLASFAQRLHDQGRLVQLFDHTSLLRGLDLFSFTMALPREIINPSVWEGLGRGVANLVLNVMYTSEITSAAAHPEVSEHPCSSPEICSTCTPQAGRFPGSRLTFELITEYLYLRSAPAVVQLSPKERIWIGSWQNFLQENQNKNITVRSDYTTAKNRNFFEMQLGKFLQETGVVDASGNAIRASSVVQSSPGPPLYAGNNKLSIAQMRDYGFKYPSWIPRKFLQRPSLWMGPDRSFSGLHVDHSNTGNLAYQVLGQKEWHLFPPRSSPFMYGRQRGIVTWSLVRDPRRYAKTERLISKFPDFRFAVMEGIVVNVGEGEMMYNPPDWWHAVHNTEASLMLNFWVKPPEVVVNLASQTKKKKPKGNSNNNNLQRKGK